MVTEEITGSQEEFPTLLQAAFWVLLGQLGVQRNAEVGELQGSQVVHGSRFSESGLMLVLGLAHKGGVARSRGFTGQGLALTLVLRPEVMTDTQEGCPVD